MVTLTQLLVLIGVTWGAAYTRARTGSALVIAGAALLVMTFFGEFALVPWLLLGAVAILFLADDLRKDKITRPIFKMFKSVLPPMNQTEQEALEAGDVWWDGELFKGHPDWAQLLGYKKPELSAEEQAFIDNQVETVCGMVSDWDINFKDKDLPVEAWDYLKKEGFLGLMIPKKYGGKEFSALAHSAIVSKLSTASGVLGVSTMVPNSLGPAELLMHYGTEEQKNHYLPRLAKGQDIPCFALTGPTAGSDAGAIPDSGVVCKGEFEGKEVLGLRLNWNKRYITLAPIATVLGLAFKMYDPDGLLGDQEDIGITVALIPTSHPGVETGERHYPMGQAFMNGPTRGKDVFIPLDWIVGGPEFAGKGWRMLVECLSAGRGISLPSSSTATAKLAYRATGAYSVLREQFKTQIGKFEGVEEALARIAGATYQLEAARIMTAGSVDLGAKPSVITAIAKYHMTESARSVLTDAMDVHGGRGVIMGERNYLSSGYQSMPISITVEGANILTRNLMIFGQGAVRCHPFVYREMQAANNPNEQAGIDEFDSLFFRHIGYGLSNFIRSLSLGVTAAKIVKKPVSGPTGRFYQQLTRMSSALALVADLSMAVLGGDLKRKERLSARLGDVLSYLYLSSTVLKYYEDNGRKESDLPYVEWNIQNNLYLMQKAFNEFFDNLKPAWLGAMLRRVVFPFGASYKKPSDRLDHKIVQSMFNQNELRDRLTDGIFIGDETYPVGRVEHAFNLVLATQPIALKIKLAVKEGKLVPAREFPETVETAVAAGILTQQEANDLLTAEAARLDAIQVDDYSKAYIRGEFEEPLAKTEAAA
ncbi:acyl-CoA dehydrogenase [Aliikangiella marina]|uniref:Acyl-coenzyme A dehydrogenase n=1 Tax=Aliikangiella marina TaxID=1712262 RepID=A0A545T2L4_9GAMM|nr:acyl-CoA dehydrogenase [Aliikangiella marina]TQV71454.1 acyl-CoA dehydrogenase [Aliikangiella marina]